MKKIILSSLFALAIMGGCNNKQLTQQKNEAERAQKLAVEQVALAKRSAQIARQAETQALRELQKAERAQQVALLAAKKAKMAEVQCKTQNKLLQEKIARLEKQKK